MNSLFFPTDRISLMIFQNTMNNCNNSYKETICNPDKEFFETQSTNSKSHGSEYGTI